MTCKQCDVVVVPFPFTEKLATKRRPALVLSREEFNKRGVISSFFSSGLFASLRPVASPERSRPACQRHGRRTNCNATTHDNGGQAWQEGGPVPVRA